MKEKVLFGIIGVFTIVTILLLFNSFTTSPKVVVVDSQKVLEDYQGFIEAKDSYELKVKNLTQDFNEKRKIFESQSMEFKTGLGKLSEIQKAIDACNRTTSPVLKEAAISELNLEGERDKELSLVDRAFLNLHAA